MGMDFLSDQLDMASAFEMLMAVMNSDEYDVVVFDTSTNWTHTKTIIIS